MDPIALIATAWRLRRRIRELRPDVVLAHGGWAVQVAALASPRRGPALVWQRILDFSAGMTRGGRARWWRVVCRRVDAAVALAPAMEQELRAHRFRRAGVDDPELPSARALRRRRPGRGEHAAARASSAIGAEPALLGLVGHLIEQKRPERALDVLGRVRATGADAHLVVAGTGPLEPAFVDEARAPSLAPVVHRARAPR